MASWASPKWAKWAGSEPWALGSTLRLRVIPVDGRNPFRTTVQNPWNDDSHTNTNKQWFSLVSKWCRISSTVVPRSEVGP